jgi:hypothetical protein
LKRGYLQDGERLSLSGQALTIPPRVMADLFVRHLHPEVSIFEEEGTVLPPNSPFYYWRVPGGRGIILHTFYGAPVLMDFAMVNANHTECLDRDAFENIYNSENFGQSERIRIIQDSDEFSILSLTPTKDIFLQPTVKQPRWLQTYSHLCNIRESMWHHAGRNKDVLMRDLFRLPIRWNITDLDEVWMKEEQRVDRLINSAVGDYYSISKVPNTHRFPSKLKADLYPRIPFAKELRLLFFTMPVALAAWSRLAIGVIVVIRVVTRRIGLALCGDRVTLRWWGWRLRKLGAGLVGRQFLEPRPPSP